MNNRSHFSGLLLYLPLILIFISSASLQAKAKRIALVIGNDNYSSVAKLEKALSDARSIARTLRTVGFTVTHLENLNNRSMTRGIYSDFISSIKKDDEVLFYYAGHGIEIRSRNYLLATDIPKVKPGNERFVTKEAFAVDDIIEAVQERGSRLAIFILDACRDNPFPKEGTRSIGTTRGLGRSDPPKGTFVMYSAGSRQAALDRLSSSDRNTNSVYTRKLLPLIQTPGLKLTEMAKRLRGEVEELASKVNHDQYPAYYDQMKGEFYFTPSSGSQKKISSTEKVDKSKSKVSALEKRLKDLEAQLQKEKSNTKTTSEKITEKKEAPPKTKTALLTASKQVVSPSSKRSLNVAEHVEFLDAVFTHIGVRKLASHRYEMRSCSGCVPVLIYCTKPFHLLRKTSKVRVAANKASMKYLKKFKHVRPVILASAEVVSALKTGIISCKATGGGKPKFSLNGPMPAGWENKGLPKSKLK
ncbi:hypothetical protein NBRC116602_19620 [Hyphomicrobiales bacterium 4NK60-0047b]